MKDKPRIIPGSLLLTLQSCDGYYECPVDLSGKRLGPLVGYAGLDDCGQQLVGEIYANFARLERWPRIARFWTGNLFSKLLDNNFLNDQTVFCGAPEGGKHLACHLADLSSLSYIYPEKQVTRLKTNKLREQSRLVWGRHEPDEGDEIILVEDVVNNSTTTIKMIELIEERGASVKVIVCYLNRSIVVGDHFLIPKTCKIIPILAVLRQPMNQWRQDDPAVAADIAAGNVVLSPKKENWPSLMAAMKKAKAA